ncbi:MAG: DegT/DnrJ/EryC1/StrS family aminotransferase [Bdellovibrionales bacterium]
MSGSYPLFKVHMPVDETLEKIRGVLQSGFVNEGVQVTEFQKALCSYLDVKNLVLMNACTSALTVAYKVAGVKPDTEVVTSPMTCIATNTPIENLGGKIVWADVLPNSGSIDPKDIERKITKHTKAIAYVNWGGMPCDLEVIDAIGKKHGIPVVQDAAHAFGAKWNGRPISDFADFTCYSFQAIKHLTSGDGGALICRKDKDLALAKKLKWFGYDREATKDEKGEWKGQRWSADIEQGEIGFKFNMNNISAAIGLSQMPHIDRILSAHRNNAAVYNRLFEGSNIIRPLDVPAKASPSYWVYTALVVSPKVNRDALLEALNAEGIAAGLVHLPNDIYTAFKPYAADLPGVRAFADRQISLPCGWWLNEKDCEHIASRVLALAGV